MTNHKPPWYISLPHDILHSHMLLYTNALHIFLPCSTLYSHMTNTQQHILHNSKAHYAPTRNTTNIHIHQIKTHHTFIIVLGICLCVKWIVDETKTAISKILCNKMEKTERKCRKHEGKKIEVTIEWKLLHNQTFSSIMLIDRQNYRHIDGQTEGKA